jgi:hypothetical protein
MALGFIVPPSRSCGLREEKSKSGIVLSFHLSGLLLPQLQPQQPYLFVLCGGSKHLFFEIGWVVDDGLDRIPVEAGVQVTLPNGNGGLVNKEALVVSVNRRELALQVGLWRYHVVDQANFIRRNPQLRESRNSSGGVFNLLFLGDGWNNK